MNDRQRRLGRVIEYRRRQLDSKLAEVRVYRGQHERALSSLKQEEDMLAQAAQHRRRLLEASSPVGDWVEAQRWLDDRTHCLDLARTSLREAEESLSQAQRDTLKARNDLKRVELLKDRLVLQAQQEVAKREQKLTDEHATRSFRKQRTEAGRENP